MTHFPSTPLPIQLRAALWVAFLAGFEMDEKTLAAILHARSKMADADQTTEWAA